MALRSWKVLGQSDIAQGRVAPKRDQLTRTLRDMIDSYPEARPSLYKYVLEAQVDREGYYLGRRLIQRIQVEECRRVAHCDDGGED